MKQGTFLDTSGWFAAMDSRSTQHGSLARRYRTLITEAQPFLTTNLVVAEMHALLSRRAGIEIGLGFLDQLYRDQPTRSDSSRGRSSARPSTGGSVRTPSTSSA